MSMIGRLMPTTQELWYAVEEDCSEARYSLRTSHFYHDDIAEIAAEDYWYNHDGWESRWPRTFAFYRDCDGSDEPFVRVRVDMAAEPSFYVTHEARQAADTVDPQASDTGKPATREETATPDGAKTLSREGEP